MAQDGNINDYFNELKNEAKSLIDINTYAKMYGDIEYAATQLNKAFTQNRERIVEMKVAISDTLPAITRLGGSFEDVQNTISEIAAASNRNVIANVESAEKLYAVSKVIERSVEDITENFAEIGITFDKIGKNVEESISYVQSIGGNAAVVMRKVLQNTEQINRYQFEGGVLGLTKMAAQASMLRFDMSNTFSLAEKVLNPESAVEVASAFQRLGVSVGNLVDPFQLMNQSINDPSGLQESLINVGKQFTYFDEKAKAFKINPQGVLTLKQIEEQTGVSSKELMKAGLAAAELDARLSSISPTIKFTNEEDKQYLANIASMNEKGEYTVNIRDEFGNNETKRLVDVTQDEMNRLIEAQKKEPKTIEEIQRNQLTLSEVIMSDVRAIKNSIVGGVVTAPTLNRVGESIRETATNITGSLSDIVSPKFFRDIVDFVPKKISEALGGSLTDMTKSVGETVNGMVGSIKDKFGIEGLGDFNPTSFNSQSGGGSLNGDGSLSELLMKQTDGFGTLNKSMIDFNIQSKILGDKFDINSDINTKNIDLILKDIQSGKESTSALTEYIKQHREELKNVGGNTNYYDNMVDFSNKLTKTLSVVPPTSNNLPTSNPKYGNQFIDGIQPNTDATKIIKSTSVTNTTTVLNKVEFGKIIVEIKLPANFEQLTTEQQRQVLDKVFNSPNWQDMSNQVRTLSTNSLNQNGNLNSRSNIQ